MTDLQLVKSHLQQIYESISYFQPLTARPPIIDSSFEAASESNEESQWLKQENIPGLKKLKENIGIDLVALDKFLDDPASANLPPLSTNAPYLIAVWNEVLCAPPQIVSIFKTFSINTSTIASDASRMKDARPLGVKVDVIANNGRHWIRVNTAKNSRLLSEFREIDSYLTDSESELDDDLDDTGPSLAQTQLDNSVLRMGKSLIDAARANPIDGNTEIPKVTLRLTRLDPTLTNDDGTKPDARITQTLESLQEMGIDVQLGERTESELPVMTNDLIERPCSPSLPFIPTLNINLDLSILIALISDLVHAPLPTSIEDANKRFLPPPEYREWKKQKLADNQKPPGNYKSTPPQPTSVVEVDINDLPNDLIKHSRALTNQLLQEMGKGLLQEMHDRISALCTGDPTKPKVTFWTTPEARDRCLRIISKIGGVHEKRRAHALFCYDTEITASGGHATIPLDEALRLYWQDSRFEPNFVPLLPIHIYPTSSIPTLIPGSSSTSSQELPIPPRSSISPFAKSLDIVCTDILAQETMPHPRSLPDEVVGRTSEIQRATVLKANPRLTAHTVQSMHWGAYLGWTTLTANRTSVKAILREMKTARVSGRLAGVDLHLEQPRGSGRGRLLNGDGDLGAENDEEGGSAGCAAFWVVDPRSLAEGMSSQSVQGTITVT